jgi:hypothetical protein
MWLMVMIWFRLRMGTNRSRKQDEWSIFWWYMCNRIFKRTEGISTTDIVGRLLLMTKEIMWEEKVVSISRELCRKFSEGWVTREKALRHPTSRRYNNSSKKPLISSTSWRTRWTTTRSSTLPDVFGNSATTRNHVPTIRLSISMDHSIFSMKGIFRSLRKPNLLEISFMWALTIMRYVILIVYFLDH